MILPKPLGLALSGGGFRAAAFHLGVLKRLRELGLLKHVDLVSTVSGGSITGAYWVYWQAKQAGSQADDHDWDGFESSLIRFMQSGAREWAMWRGFWIPFLLLLLIIGSAAAYFFKLWYVWPITLRIAMMLALVAASGILAYMSWHYRASKLFQRRLDRVLFKGAILHDLSPRCDMEGVPWPHLIVNATGLNSGDHLLFTPQPQDGTHGWRWLERVLPDTSGIPQSRDKRSQTQPRDTAPRVSLGLNTPLAGAVAASCAIPSVFAPLSFDDPEDWWETPSWWPGRFLAVDGGVNDNQGTQVLLDGKCPAIIVSDAAGALRTIPRPSTWQIFPPGKGVIFRSQNIIYERMRDLGYQRLEERYEFTRRLNEAGLLRTKRLRHVPILKGYAYVELWPSDSFRWETKMRLGETLTQLVASIRTDLDKFSSIEISALMFHGYTMIDQCIRAYRSDWLPRRQPPLDFDSPVKDVCIPWGNLPCERLVSNINHLMWSDSRIALYRALGRIWGWLRYSRKARNQGRALVSDANE